MKNLVPFACSCHQVALRSSLYFLSGMQKFDLIVIGAGSGRERVGKLDMKVVLLAQNELLVMERK